MNRRDNSRTFSLYVELSDLARLNRGYQDDAETQGMYLVAQKFEGAAIAYEFAAKRIWDVFAEKDWENFLGGGNGSEGKAIPLRDVAAKGAIPHG